MTKTNKEDTELYYIVVNKHTLTENSMTQSKMSLGYLGVWRLL